MASFPLTIQKQRIYSFDVFDTCLTRIFAQPTDLFFEWERRVLTFGKIKEKISSKTSLALCRIRAEKKARKNKAQEDICFADIYQYMGSLGLSDDDLSFLMKSEMELEEESLVPIPEILQKIEEIRKKNNAPILFISNMYLPCAFIQRQLLRHGIAKPDDPVYVSGDIGLSKHTGSLFKYVLKKHNLQPEQLVHTGNNPRSDIKAAQQLGIHTVHYTGATLTNRERIIASQKQSDKITNSIIAGASRLCRIRLCPEPEFDEFEIDTITSIAAPILTAFTAWVLKSAYQDGIERLYFLSRDAQLLYKIAKILSRKIPAPECRYLYSSRQAWIGAAINKTQVETDGIKAICIGDTAKSPFQIFERLGIQRSELPSDLLLNIGICSDNLDTKMRSSETESFCMRLSSHPILKKLILARATYRRENTLSYLEQEGLFTESCRWAIVDVGWRLSSQKALYDLLKMAGSKQQPKGYYFGLSANSYPVELTGPCKAFTTDFQKNKKGLVCLATGKSSIVVLEKVFLQATHPHVSSYTQRNEKIVPIYSQSSVPVKQKLFTDTLHKIVLDFADFFSSSEALFNNVEQNRESSLTNWIKFITRPLLKEVVDLQWLPVNIEFTQDASHTRMLASSIKISDLFQMIIHHIRHTQHYENPNHAWIEGSAVLSAPLVRWSFFNLQKIRRYIAS